MNKYITAIMAELADVLSIEYRQGNSTNVLRICEKEHIEIIEDDFGVTFDSILVRNNKNVTIHLNKERKVQGGNHLGRIAMAHELGYYFAKLLENDFGEASFFMHILKSEVMYSDWAEKVAQNFARRLLMPSFSYLDKEQATSFSMNVVNKLSDRFNVSVIFALMRIIETGGYQLMAVFSRNRQICWSTRSLHFPDLENKFRRWSPLPSTSSMTPVDFENQDYCSEIGLGDVECWFKYGKLLAESQLFEQQLYTKEFDLSVNLLWFS